VDKSRASPQRGEQGLDRAPLDDRGEAPAREHPVGARAAEGGERLGVIGDVEDEYDLRLLVLKELA
jgi:hypothetical protein